MKSLLGIFYLRRGERWLALIAFLFFVVLNGLFIAKYAEFFTRGGNLGFWTIFTEHFSVSGFDCYTYVMLSRWKIYYSLYRHPLIALFFYPLAMLNHWLMAETGMNWAVYIMAFLLVLMSVYSIIFMYRIFREIIGLQTGFSFMLAFLLFSFGYMMLSCFVPDHFGISVFLIITTLYLAGRCIRAGKPMKSWQTAIMFLLAAGVTLTNGVFVLLASWITAGRRFFTWRNLAVSVGFPVLIMAACYMYQEYEIALPDSKVQEANIQRKLKKDKKFAEKYWAQKKWLSTRKESHGQYLEWVNLHTSRSRSFVENFFGESIQYHSDYLLEDTSRSRPIFVNYRYAYQYVVIGMLLMLFMVGVFFGIHDHFFQLAFGWFLFNILLHVVIGFGIIEAYIMSPHWLFVIPISLAYLLQRLETNYRVVLGIILSALLVYLYAYNGILLVGFLTN